MAIYDIVTHNWQSSYLNIEWPSEICNKIVVTSAGKKNQDGKKF